MNQEQTTGKTIDPDNLDVETPDEFQIRVDFPNIPPGAASGEIDESDIEFGVMDALTGGASVAEQMEERSKKAILAAMSTIQEMALQTDLMRKGIPGGSQPRMIKIKFGVNLDFEAGALLARSGVGATMEIELEWARRSDDVLRVLRAETDVDNALFAPSE